MHCGDDGDTECIARTLETEMRARLGRSTEKLRANGHVRVKECRCGAFRCTLMYTANDRYLGRSLDLYGEWETAATHSGDIQDGGRSSRQELTVSQHPQALSHDRSRTTNGCAVVQLPAQLLCHAAFRGCGRCAVVANVQYVVTLRMRTVVLFIML